jgi:hypothetical protein
MRGYIAFVKDMGFPIDKARVIEVWKKAGRNHKPHDYETFKNSLQKLSIASYLYKQDQNTKKIKEISQAIEYVKSNQKLPIAVQLRVY